MKCLINRIFSNSSQYYIAVIHSLCIPLLIFGKNALLVRNLAQFIKKPVNAHIFSLTDLGSKRSYVKLIKY